MREEVEAARRRAVDAEREASKAVVLARQVERQLTRLREQKAAAESGAVSELTTKLEAKEEALRTTRRERNALLAVLRKHGIVHVGVPGANGSGPAQTHLSSHTTAALGGGGARPVPAAGIQAQHRRQQAQQQRELLGEQSPSPQQQQQLRYRELHRDSSDDEEDSSSGDEGHSHARADTPTSHEHMVGAIGRRDGSGAAGVVATGHVQHSSCGQRAVNRSQPVNSAEPLFGTQPFNGAQPTCSGQAAHSRHSLVQDSSAAEGRGEGTAESAWMGHAADDDLLAARLEELDQLSVDLLS